MERWLKAARRYREVPEADMSTKWRRSADWESAEKFVGSEKFIAALELLSAAKTEIVLAEENHCSRRRRRLERTPRSTEITLRVILDGEGFKLVWHIWTGTIRAAIYASGWKHEVKPPQPLKLKGVLKLCRLFGIDEFSMMHKIWKDLDELTAYAP